MKIIAHRGASAYAPENTLAAFSLALEMGAGAIELDVHQTKDGRLVVLHDADLKRVAGLKARVADLAWPELSRLDVGRWFSERFAGQRVPLLEQVLDLALGRAELHVELKEGGKACPGIEERLAALLRARRALKEAAVSSFDHAALRRLREEEPSLRIGLLVGSSFPSPLGTALGEAVRLKAESLNLSRRLARPASVREARRRGLQVLVYTVNDLAELRALEAAGVDGVFSDRPDLGAALSLGGTAP